MSLLLDKLESLAEQADSAGQSRAAVELRAVRVGVATALERCAAVETLRDKFAMAALQGRMAIPGICDHAFDAKLCYDAADAMLQERAKCE